MARNHVPIKHALGPLARAFCGARPATLLTGWRRVTCVRCCEVAVGLGSGPSSHAGQRYAQLTLPGRTDLAKIDAWLET